MTGFGVSARVLCSNRASVTWRGSGGVCLADNRIPALGSNFRMRGGAYDTRSMCTLYSIGVNTYAWLILIFHSVLAVEPENSQTWAFVARAGRRLHSPPSRHNSPTHPDSFFSFEAEQSFLQGFSLHVQFNSWQAISEMASVSSLVDSVSRG